MRRSGEDEKNCTGKTTEMRNLADKQNTAWGEGSETGRGQERGTTAIDGRIHVNTTQQESAIRTLNLR